MKQQQPPPPSHLRSAEEVKDGLAGGVRRHNVQQYGVKHSLRVLLGWRLGECGDAPRLRQRAAGGRRMVRGWRTGWCCTGADVLARKGHLV
jgi:hypothetical protein